MASSLTRKQGLSVGSGGQTIATIVAVNTLCPNQEPLRMSFLPRLTNMAALLPVNSVLFVVSQAQRCVVVSMRLSPVFRWGATSLQKTLSIHVIVTITNMAGDGHCSLHQNNFTELLPTSALVPQKSLSSGCSHIYEPFYPKQKRRNLKGYSFDYRTQMKQKGSLTICGRPFII